MTTSDKIHDIRVYSCLCNNPYANVAAYAMCSAGKTLLELKVTEIKSELEKRKLDKVGVKATLLERLEEAVRAEGHDPTTYQFNAEDKSARPVKQDPAPPPNAVAEEKPHGNDGKNQEEVSNEGGKTGSLMTPNIESKDVEVVEKEDNKVDESEEIRLEEPLDNIEDDLVVDPESEDEDMSAPVESKDGDDSHLWISNIPNTTKASDLKALFSEFGKVQTAKIFTTKNNVSPACYGSVSMCNASDAANAKSTLNRTNWKGRIISIEVVSAAGPPPADAAKSSQQASRKPIEPPPKSPSHDAKSRRSSSKSSHHRAEIRAPESAKSTKSTVRPTRSETTSYTRRGTSSSARSQHVPGTHRNIRERSPVNNYRRMDARQQPAFVRGSVRGTHYPPRVYDNRRTVHPPLVGRYDFDNRAAARVYDENEVRRIIQQSADTYRRREEALEREKEKAQMRLEKERLERERLELQQMKLQLQLEAQQQASVLQQQPPPMPSMPTSFGSVPANANKSPRKTFARPEHLPDSRTLSRRVSRSPVRRVARRSRSPIRRRAESPRDKTKYSSSHRPRNPAASYSASSRHAAGGSHSYGTSSYSSSKKSGDSTNALNEKLAALSNVYGPGSQADGSGSSTYFPSRSAPGPAPSSYSRVDQYRYGAEAPTPSYSSTGESFAAPDYGNLTGGWNRQHGDWYGNSNTATDSYAKSTSYRRY